MSENLEDVLNAARKLPLEQQQQLVEKLLEAAGRTDKDQKDAQAVALEAVEKTHGTIKGLDRKTVIWLAEDEELCGY